MDIRLLGPVELHGGSRPIYPGPPKQRCVLAALALNAGHQVSASALIAYVWGPHPPPAARNSLSSYVAKLRAALRTQDAAIRRLNVGYVLDIAMEKVDFHRFAALTSAGIRSGDSRTLDAALHLWRGEPLAGLSGSWVERVRVDLGDRYVAALIAWARLGIQEGRGNEVVERIGHALTVYRHNTRLIEFHQHATEVVRGVPGECRCPEST